ncbi:MAG: hypothetical protein COV75_07350 [Candidatus Omnitrophica bacterium CG11_big_fil_rev_8_21_14_0_20_63_9]|nr:MAG: hypothetical protein COV75_07350 [Candidatus Omnitrophica bacterium CG11_big_fil_rev_8_21_14_0_20_63_9]
MLRSRIAWWAVRWLARSQGFLDPVSVLKQLEQFGQPADVLAPGELLRAGAVMHARGMMNTQAIQHNLDWVWPYWVVRQFDPADPAFVPRAFSLTHINLTHRNWTAVGLPDVPELPIVDPRGLVTPWLAGWSLDGWIVTHDRRALFPSQTLTGSQRLLHEGRLTVVTETCQGALTLRSMAEVIDVGGVPTCQIRLLGWADTAGWLVAALRPYNPEGVSPIHRIDVVSDRTGWIVNGQHPVAFAAPPQRFVSSHYRLGDVATQLSMTKEEPRTECPVGLATAAALFPLVPGTPVEVTIHVPLVESRKHAHTTAHPIGTLSSWDHALAGHCLLQVPDAHWQFLYETAVRTLILHGPGDVYAGPYTYKRFWFRDAAFIIHAMLCAGLTHRAERALDRFPSRQTPLGYFRSQEGEWDSNGQALWILQRFCEMTARPPKPQWSHAIARAGRWIQRKRLSPRLTHPHAGLLPAGFSAEHLGPNDYYYWDDFWAVAGLRAAASLTEADHQPSLADSFRREADDLLTCIDRSLEFVRHRLSHLAVPASVYRRMDAGAVGSLAASYPLQLWAPDDSRIQTTVNFLLTNCFFKGGFFHSISHSGINPYLTLHVAQVLLRSADLRHQEVMRAITELASPTGQWPEAVHPTTRGGCMGDGQHVWAAAEWLLMVRNSFVREEGRDRLVLCSGLPPAWCDQPATFSFGPAPTSHGTVSVSVRADGQTIVVSWSGQWHASVPAIDVHLPGYPCMAARSHQSEMTIKRNALQVGG